MNDSLSLHFLLILLLIGSAIGGGFLLNSYFSGIEADACKELGYEKYTKFSGEPYCIKNNTLYPVRYCQEGFAAKTKFCELKFGGGIK